MSFFPNGISYCGAFANGNVLYIDDMAMLNPAEHFFLAPITPEPLPMMGLVVGPDANDGESTLDVCGSIDQLHASIEWIDRAAFEAWANDRSRGAAITAGDKTLQTWSDLAASSGPGR